MDRLEYADKNRDRYGDWAYELANTPYSELDLLELAILSAHCPFDKMIDAFKATRNVGDMGDYADLLNWHGLIGSYKRAGYVFTLRDMLADGYTMPGWSQREYRRTHKLPGMGICKLSFACCLLEPLTSDVICLDTHMLQVYMGRMPTKQEVNRVYNNLAAYESIESEMIAESNEVGMSPFMYQWAVWDWWRARNRQVPPSDHSFLWRNPTTFQYSMEDLI